MRRRKNILVVLSLQLTNLNNVDISLRNISSVEWLRTWWQSRIWLNLDSVVLKNLIPLKIRIQRVSNIERLTKENFEPHFVKFWINIGIAFEILGPKTQLLWKYMLQIHQFLYRNETSLSLLSKIFQRWEKHLLWPTKFLLVLLSQYIIGFYVQHLRLPELWWLALCLASSGFYKERWPASSFFLVVRCMRFVSRLIFAVWLL